MHPFRYLKAADVPGAIRAVASEHQAMYVAGGSSLIDVMKLDVLTPTLLVDITALPLGEIEEFGEEVRIGALARNSDVAYHPVVRERYPLLAQAILAGATAQLRNVATVGGNLLQHCRCPYFREVTSPCNRRVAGSGCSALDGYNRPHAILGGGTSCIAAYVSDMGVALTALDAVVQIEGARGRRSVALGEFYQESADQPGRTTVLEHGELITAVDLPPSPFANHSHYLKVRERTSFAFATVSVAAALDVQDGKVRDARLVLGGVATRPWRATSSEALLIGHAPDPTLYQEAAQMALRETWPRRDNAFKVELTRRAIVRALSIVGGKL